MSKKGAYKLKCSTHKNNFGEFLSRYLKTSKVRKIDLFLPTGKILGFGQQNMNIVTRIQTISWTSYEHLCELTRLISGLENS